MKIQEKDLLENEKVFLSNHSNLIVQPKNFGVENMVFDDYMWAVGMKDKEALGGRIYLTNYRLIFKSHFANRIRGKISIFHPSIKEIRNTSFLMTKKITIESHTSKVDFVMWGIDKFLHAFNTHRPTINSSTMDEIQNQIIEHPEKCSDGLKTWNSLNTINNLMLIGKEGEDLSNLVTNPIGALGSIFMKEMVDNTIKKDWQEAFD